MYMYIEHRIVAAGRIGRFVLKGSPRVFMFDQEYGQTNEEALAISDHYPIEFQLAATGEMLLYCCLWQTTSYQHGCNIDLINLQ